MTEPQFVRVMTRNLHDDVETPMLVAVADITTVALGRDGHCWTTLRVGSQISLAEAEFSRLAGVLIADRGLPQGK